MHHKRGRPKNRRAGCLLCKPWKMNKAKKSWKTKRDNLADIKAKEEIIN